MSPFRRILDELLAGKTVCVTLESSEQAQFIRRLVEARLALPIREFRVGAKQFLEVGV
jgi:hypothetical protein